MNLRTTQRNCAWALGALVLLRAATVLAMPPHPDLVTRVGQVAPACDRDRALGTFDARTLSRFRAGAAASDSFKVLAILVRYSDVPASTSPASFDTLLYVPGTGSVRDFYSECSYGQLDLVTVDLPSSVGWMAAPQTATYYSNGEYGLGAASYPRNARKLVEEAVAAADPMVDFSEYDNDNNGWVDVVMVIHTGPGAEFTGNTDDIWSHKWSISPQQRDNVWVGSYTMMPEYWSSPGDITIGVFAHELGHGFGLPDLYDTDYSSRGLGRWSVMAGGAWNGSLGDSPAHFDAWCKVQLGFVSPITPTSQMVAAPIPQATTNGVVYRLWDAGLVGSEYFLVENRQRAGFDAGLPGDGLLIWHVDDNVVTDNTQEWYLPDHTSSGHYLVALEQADSLFQLEKNQNYGNSGDPFPGSANKRTFNSTTSPNSLSYAGLVSFVSVSNISDSDSLMTADFSVSLISGITDDIRPQTVWARNYPNPFNAGTRIEVSTDRPGPLTLSIYDLLGRQVKTFHTPRAQAGYSQWLWNGTDEAGVPVASGVYWYKVETAAAVARGKMVLLK